MSSTCGTSLRAARPRSTARQSIPQPGQSPFHPLIYRPQAARERSSLRRLCSTRLSAATGPVELIPGTRANVPRTPTINTRPAKHSSRTTVMHSNNHSGRSTLSRCSPAMPMAVLMRVALALRHLALRHRLPTRPWLHHREAHPQPQPTPTHSQQATQLRPLPPARQTLPQLRLRPHPLPRQLWLPPLYPQAITGEVETAADAIGAIPHPKT